MAMKFVRHMDAECVQFEVLSEDWTKFVLLLDNREVEFHSQFGKYYTTRIPKVSTITILILACTSDPCFRSTDEILYLTASPVIF